jgi:diguanylate cyclase (GGDEF)-like protein
MPVSPASLEAVSRLASGIVQAVDVCAAYHFIAAELSALLGARTVVLRLTESGWVGVAGMVGDPPDRRWLTALEDLSSGRRTVVRFGGSSDGPLTALALSDPGEPAVAALVEGDSTAPEESINMIALVVSASLRSLRDRDDMRRAQKQLVGAYAMVRRLSRLGTPEAVAQRIVDHTARMLGADRVSLALYNDAADSLSVVATKGYPSSQVEHVRIAPGTWVIGHVFAFKRPVFVQNIRLMPSMIRHQDRYRSFSFGAVPLLAGRDAIGVLSVTDKRDGSVFDRRDEIVLRDISTTAALSLIAARSKVEADRLAYAATTDSVTGLLNRPSLDARLHQEVERARRDSGSLAVLMADIDDFKRVNDTAGHQAGDAVLQFVGGILRSSVRVFDVCARYGGDEFVILMPNCDRQSAVACAERIRQRVEQRAAGDDSLPPLTMSVGVAVAEADDSAAELLRRADRFLYHAKTAGKNTVWAHPADASLPGAGDRFTLMAPRPSPDAAGGEAHGLALPYALIADTNHERSLLCTDAIKPFWLGVLIARSSQQAIRVIEQFGAPALLLVDLALPEAGGLPVVDAAAKAMTARVPRIIAWSGSRELREYATSHLKGQHARLLSGTASAHTIRAAIARALSPAGGGRPTGDSPAELFPNSDFRQVITRLSERVRAATTQPGLAIYLRLPNEAKYRAVFSWAADDLMPHSPHHIPRAFDTVRDTGDTVVLRDIANVRDLPPAGVDDAVRGLVAVPITAADQRVGAICVFDVKPLSITAGEIEALAALGRSVFEETGRSPAPVRLEPDAAPAEPSTFRERADDRRPDDPGRPRRGPVIIDWPPTLLERAGGEFAVAREIARARREGHQLSVVLFDVTAAAESALDAQDERLERVASTLLRTIRQSDLPIRWSVTELLVVLPGLGGSEARTVAERVRAALQAGAQHQLAVSGGVAEIAPDERFSTVVDRARQKLSTAVGGGHNRVV